MITNYPSGLRLAKIPLKFGTGAMPALGFGTLIPDPAETRSATANALKVGFRHFDCAERYRNEREVGEALQTALGSGVVAREDLFLTTKLWNSNHRPERVGPAFDGSCERLGIRYADLYLIHTPFAFQAGDNVEPRDASGNIIYDKGVTLLDTWKAMESLVDQGKCRAIGLSDVVLENLVPVYEAARIKPAVVQVEAHPYHPQTELLEFCKQKGIVLLAFAPLGHGAKPGPLEDAAVLAIARQTSLTPAQVLLAWGIQRGTAVLTTAKTLERARENYEIAEIPEAAVEKISRIQTRVRLNSVTQTGVPGFIPKEGKR
ncbi:MAG TPA: aldo/keto reductase [Verrucomicrobiae bacterium]|nr:aldo/keto reductase [Verrucomicrobiae bacterium]